jgi:hypothetical protein
MTWFTVQCVVCRDEEFEVTKTIRVEAQNERQAAAMVCGGPLVQGETGARLRAVVWPTALPAAITTFAVPSTEWRRQSVGQLPIATQRAPEKTPSISDGNCTPASRSR